MAQLTALSNFAKNSIANSGASELSVMLEIDKLQYDSDFKNLFPLNDELINRICESMCKDGYDKSQPIHVLKNTNILLDGHNRVEAAKRAGLKEIPAYFHNFENKETAIEYAILLQTNRRNLSDAELFEAVNFLDKLKNPGIQSTDTPKGKSAELLAKKIGVSRSKIEKVRAIKNKGDEKIIKAVTDGTMSINAGYNAVKTNDEIRETNDTAKVPEVFANYSCELKITEKQLNRIEAFFKKENIKYFLVKDEEK